MIEVTLTRLLRDALNAAYPDVDAETSVFPLVAPSGAAAPFIIYTRSSTSRLYDFDGDMGLATPTFRVDVYADSYGAVRLLANTVRKALNGYSDDHIRDIKLKIERDLSDLVQTPGLFRVQLEFTVEHNEE